MGSDPRGDLTAPGNPRSSRASICEVWMGSESSGRAGR